MSNKIVTFLIISYHGDNYDDDDDDDDDDDEDQLTCRMVEMYILNVLVEQTLIN